MPDEVALSLPTTVWVMVPSEIVVLMVVTTSSLRRRLWEATSTKLKISGTLIISYDWPTVAYYGQWLLSMIMK